MDGDSDADLFEKCPTCGHLIDLSRSSRGDAARWTSPSAHKEVRGAPTVPMFRRKPSLVEAVQWTGDDQAWVAICALHADSELVAFREDDGTVSIETTGGRAAAQRGDWIIK